ncbi:Uncharacterised protein [Plesiomonas shigelloides]|nr:Uncharacterised protein [Plesiomonas shigelloides]
MDNCFRAAYRISASSLATVMSSATLTTGAPLQRPTVATHKKTEPIGSVFWFLA